MSVNDLRELSVTELKNKIVDLKKELWVRLNVHAYSESLIICKLEKSLSSVAISNLPRFAETIDHNE